jgi:hypothetical protein
MFTQHPLPAGARQRVYIRSALTYPKQTLLRAFRSDKSACIRGWRHCSFLTANCSLFTAHLLCCLLFRFLGAFCCAKPGFPLQLLRNFHFNPLRGIPRQQVYIRSALTSPKRPPAGLSPLRGGIPKADFRLCLRVRE